MLFRSLLLDVVELLDGPLDLQQVVLIGLLVKRQLLLVLGRIVLGPLELEGELAGCIAVVPSVEADLQSLALDVLLDDRSEGGDANLGGLPAPQFAPQEGIVEGSALHLLRR